MKNKVVTLKRLKELLSYDKETGVFHWKVLKGHILAGAVAGNIRKDNGRIIIGIDNTQYRAHRLAWLYHFGSWPKKDIDHINGKPFDNRICNLREATDAQNLANMKKPRTNKSGRKGVSWHKGGRKWQVHIMAYDVNYYLGLFEDLEEAHHAYMAAAIRLKGEFARAA